MLRIVVPPLDLWTQIDKIHLYCTEKLRTQREWCFCEGQHWVFIQVNKDCSYIKHELKKTHAWCKCLHLYGTNVQHVQINPYMAFDDISNGVMGSYFMIRTLAMRVDTSLIPLIAIIVIVDRFVMVRMWVFLFFWVVRMWVEHASSISFCILYQVVKKLRRFVWLSSLYI